MYQVRLSERAVKAVSKLDKGQREIIAKWIEKNLEGTDNPRESGKALTGTLKGYWRYRVGDYRLIAKIHDEEVTVEIINVGHRGKIYQ